VALLEEALDGARPVEADKFWSSTSAKPILDFFASDGRAPPPHEAVAANG